MSKIDYTSDITKDDQKRLAKKMNNHFFSPVNPLETEKAAATPPMNSSMEQLMQPLNRSPEIAEPLLQMSKIFGTKT